MKRFQFDGTRRGFHLMMLRMFPHRNWRRLYYFVNENENGNIKFKFIDKVIVEGVIYKKGDCYEA